MQLSVEGLSKRYQDKLVLDNVSFCVRAGELASVIGPSGTGKTTLLRIVAGLEEQDAGQVRFDEPPSLARPIILVFQDYLLFPTLSVFENTAFGLRARRVKGPELERRVMDILGYFGLADKREVFPAQLSAGQKQRVAIARAMVVNPAALLLDEPFANLDPNLTMQTAEFIRATQREFGITTLCVTHDLAEAFVMSDRVGVLLAGRMAQYDRAAEVYARPATLEAARFLGPVNVLDAALCNALGLDPPGRNETVFARPEAVRLTPDEAGPGRVEDVCVAGHYLRCRIRLAGQALVVYSLDDGLEPGDAVSVRVATSLRSRPDAERAAPIACREKNNL